MWTCKKCNEEIEDGFDSCWKCYDDSEFFKEIDIADAKEKEIQKKTFNQQKSTDYELLQFVFQDFPFFSVFTETIDRIGFKRNDLNKSYFDLIMKFALRFIPILLVGLLITFLMRIVSGAFGLLFFPLFIAAIGILFSFFYLIFKKSKTID